MPAAKRSIYSVHPSVAYAQAIIRNLPETTGKSIDEWIALVKKSGPSGEKERREWLKKNHQLGGTTARMIVDCAEGKGAEDTDPEAYLKAAAEYVETMYAGQKAALRPIHDALIKVGVALGADVGERSRTRGARAGTRLRQSALQGGLEPSERPRQMSLRGLQLRHAAPSIPRPCSRE